MALSAKVLVIELDKGPGSQKLLDGRPQTCGMRSGRIYLPPGEACGQHSTKDREELLVFLAGQGELLIDGQGCFQVAQDKVAYIPPHTAHDVKNTGSGPLVYVYCVAPAGGVKH